MSRVGDPVAFVESKFGIRMRRAGREEWAGPCPWCGGTDRFHVWTKGNFWCRPAPGHCGKSGWLDELDGMKPLTTEERLEQRVAELERKQAEQDRRLSALEKMHESTDHLIYHRNLDANDQARAYWWSEGILQPTVEARLLGYCPICPTAPTHDSYTIPVLCRGKLYNIRHRLCRPNDGGKYRPHVAGLPGMIYNADDLDRSDTDHILILEGEKKSIVISQETGIANIATMGAQSFKPGWAAKLDRFSRVYVCYDPDATTKSAEVADYFGTRGRVMELPVKADDFFTRHSGTKRDFLYYLNTARPSPRRNNRQ